MQKYFEVKLYLRTADTKDNFKKIAKEFGSYDKLVRQVVVLYQTGVLRPVKFR